MTYEWLGEMFEGDFSDMCTNIFAMALMVKRSVVHVETWERGTPLAPANLLTTLALPTWVVVELGCDNKISDLVCVSN